MPPRKAKHARNMSGFMQNQNEPPPKLVSELDEPVDDAEENSDQAGQTLSDSLRFDHQANDESDESDNDLEGVVPPEWDDEVLLKKQGAIVRLVRMAIIGGDDPQDEEWMPDKVRAKAAERKMKRGLNCE